jgi:hypothetical protein
MTYIYSIILFILFSATSVIHAEQIIIPITHSQNFNHEISQEHINKTTKKEKFKRNFVRHSKFKKTCIYTGCALGGIIAGICIFTFGLPIIISTILIGIEIVVRIKSLFIK